MKKVLVIIAAFAICLISCSKSSTEQPKQTISYTVSVGGLSCTEGHEADTVAFKNAVDDIVSHISKGTFKSEDELKKACQDTCEAHDGKNINAILLLYRSVNGGTNEQIGKWTVTAAQPQPKAKYNVESEIEVLEGYSAAASGISEDMNEMLAEIGKSLTTEDQITEAFKKVAAKYNDRFASGVLTLKKISGQDTTILVDETLSPGVVTYKANTGDMEYWKGGEDDFAAFEGIVKKVDGSLGQDKPDSVIVGEAASELNKINARYILNEKGKNVVISKLINGRDSIAIFDYEMRAACQPDYSEIDNEDALKAISEIVGKAMSSLSIKDVIEAKSIKEKASIVKKYSDTIDEKALSEIWEKYSLTGTIYYYVSIMNGEKLVKGIAWQYSAE